MNVSVDICESLPDDFLPALGSFRTAAGFETLVIPWSRLVQEASRDRMTLWWIAVRDARGIRALGVIFVVRRLAIGDYVGGVVERFTAFGRRFGYTPLAFDVAYVEVPLAHEEGSFFAPDVDECERSEITQALLWQLE